MPNDDVDLRWLMDNLPPELIQEILEKFETLDYFDMDFSLTVLWPFVLKDFEKRSRLMIRTANMSHVSSLVCVIDAEILGKMWKNMFDVGQRALLIEMLARSCTTTALEVGPINEISILKAMDFTPLEFSVIVRMLHPVEDEEIVLELMNHLKLEHLQTILFTIPPIGVGKSWYMEFRLGYMKHFNGQTDKVVKFLQQTPCPFHCHHDIDTTCPFIFTDEVREMLKTNLVTLETIPQPRKTLQHIVHHHDWLSIMNPDYFDLIQQEWIDLCQVDRFTILIMTCNTLAFSDEPMEEEVTIILQRFLNFGINVKELQILLNLLIPCRLIDLHSILKTFTRDELRVALWNQEEENIVSTFWTLSTADLTSIQRLEEIHYLRNMNLVNFQATLVGEDAGNLLVEQYRLDPRQCRTLYQWILPALSDNSVAVAISSLADTPESLEQVLYTFVTPGKTHKDEDVTVLKHLARLESISNDILVSLLQRLNHLTILSKYEIIYARSEQDVDFDDVVNFVEMVKRLDIGGHWKELVLCLSKRNVLVLEYGDLDWKMIECCVEKDHCCLSNCVKALNMFLNDVTELDPILRKILIEEYEEGGSGRFVFEILAHSTITVDGLLEVLSDFCSTVQGPKYQFVRGGLNRVLKSLQVRRSHRSKVREFLKQVKAEDAKIKAN